MHDIQKIVSSSVIQHNITYLHHKSRRLVLNTKLCVVVNVAYLQKYLFVLVNMLG